MNQVKLFKWSTFFLLALNITMVIFFFFTKPNAPRNESHKPIHEILNLSDPQEKQFFELVKKHQDRMQEIGKRQNKIVTQYLLASGNDSNNTSNSLLSEAQVFETQKIEATRLHFIEVRGILNEDQLPNFQKFMRGAIHNILGENKNNRPRPKDL